MNKYLKRGFFFTLLGLLAGGYGLYLKDLESDWYSIVLVLGVVVFGVGFVTIVYSLMRKIERDSIMESREKQSQEKE